MHNKLTTLAITLGLGLSLNTFALTPQHTVQFSQKDLKLYSEKNDNTGYWKIYIPNTASEMYPQSIDLNFEKGNNSKPEIVLNQLLNSYAQADCKEIKYRILEKNKTDFSFEIDLNQCSNGKSLVSLYKVFNATDGQYSILYIYDPLNTANAAEIKKYRGITLNATLGQS